MARIQHVTITAPSEDALGAMESFYRALGGTVLSRPPALVADTPGRWFGFGDTQLHLILGDPVSPPAHFALDLGDSYDRIVRELERQGHPIRTARNLWGGRRSFVHDPSGNRIELFDRPPESRPTEDG